MNLFARYASARFERRVYDDLLERWPERCAELGEERTLAAIQAAVARATARGFLSEYDVARFVWLTQLLGEAFDEDPRYPWAAAILADPRATPADKMDRLCERAARDQQGAPTGEADAQA